MTEKQVQFSKVFWKQEEGKVSSFIFNMDTYLFFLFVLFCSYKLYNPGAKLVSYYSSNATNSYFFW